jgi:hypothetical protein
MTKILHLRFMTKEGDTSQTFCANKILQNHPLSSCSKLLLVAYIIAVSKEILQVK